MKPAPLRTAAKMFGSVAAFWPNNKVHYQLIGHIGLIPITNGALILLRLTKILILVLNPDRLPATQDAADLSTIRVFLSLRRIWLSQPPNKRKLASLRNK